MIQWIQMGTVTVMRGKVNKQDISREFANYASNIKILSSDHFPRAFGDVLVLWMPFTH